MFYTYTKVVVGRDQNIFGGLHWAKHLFRHTAFYLMQGALHNPVIVFLKLAYYSFLCKYAVLKSWNCCIVPQSKINASPGSEQRPSVHGLTLDVLNMFLIKLYHFTVLQCILQLLHSSQMFYTPISLHTSTIITLLHICFIQNWGEYLC